MIFKNSIKIILNTIRYHKGNISVKKYLNKGERLLLFPHDGLGDSYLICMYLKKQSNDILVVVGKGNYQVCQLFGFNKIITVSQSKMDEMCYYLTLNPHERAHILHYDPFNLQYCFKSPIGIVGNMRGIHNTTYLNFLKDYVLKEKEQLNEPAFNYDKEKYQHIYDQIIPGKTIIMAPATSSMWSLPNNDWETMAEKLSQLGYIVLTNIVKKTDYVIKGTQPISFPLDASVPVIDYAGFFIGVRSGLCDIISSAKCCKIILHPHMIWGMSSSIEYFGLKKMKIATNIYEYEFDNENNDRLIDLIIKNIMDNGPPVINHF